MQEIKTQIVINAPIQKVWKTLIDFKAYPQWNPFMKEIRGNFDLNEQLHVTLLPPNQKQMQFKPHIVAIDQHEFHWLGKFIMPGLFDGRHSFCLRAINDNTVEFMHYEVFSGILHKPFLKIIQAATRQGFEQMNQALKKRCEA